MGGSVRNSFNMMLLCIVLLCSSTCIASVFEEFYEHMDYLAARDKILSQNIANSDTPHYLPKDIKEKQGPSGISLTTTNKMHIPFIEVTKFDVTNAEILELKPNGNGVTIENELLKKNETALDIKATANLYSRAKSLLQTAINGGSNK